MICHPIPIGSQRSLPWVGSGGWNGADPSYDVSRLQQDTLALLSPGAPLELREETLRRAVIYSARRVRLSDALAVALMARVIDAQAGGAANPSAWFDAGYFIETVRQAAQVYPMLRGTQHDAWMIRTDAPATDGLQWMRTGARLGGNPNMNAAIATVERAVHWTAAIR